MFGDSEPFDSWDAGDAPHLKAAVLARELDVLAGLADHDETVDPADAADRLEALEAEARARLMVRGLPPMIAALLAEVRDMAAAAAAEVP